VIKLKNQAKIIGSSEDFCDLCDTFKWYSNWFYSLWKKAETSYDNMTYKGNGSFINHSNYKVTDSMPTNCKDDMWTEITNICRVRSL